MNLIGTLLIAPPAVKNNFWTKSTILVTEHHPHGSCGLILNKRSDLTLQQFGAQLGFDLNIPGYLYAGGPVNGQSLSFLHTKDWTSKNTMHVNDVFSVSSADDILPRMAAGDTPIKYRLFLGMAGWSSGQLIGEIKGIPPWEHKNSWCLSKSDLGLVFDSDGADQWCHCLDRSGLEFAQSIL
jgi:putative transcriptional regulator